MSEEVLVNISPRETRVAILENKILREVYIERQKKLALIANIYKGRVTKKMPNMQAVFVDIGLDRIGFLHESDMTQEVSEGQEILVQVTREPLGSKGARLSMHLSISTRYLVLMSQSNTINISSKIADPLERERLKNLLNVDPDNGYIIRTAADGVASLAKDQDYLQTQAAKIINKFATAKVGELIYRDVSLVFRILRDLINSHTKSVTIDSSAQLQAVQNFAQEFAPDFSGKIVLHTKETPIFDLYAVNAQLDAALQPKITLPSGGYLIIEQTESMVTIDVNTGSFSKQRSFESTIYATNLEAAEAIAIQLRLRNLGGIIVIDFIDMDSREHRQKLLEVLEAAIRNDSAKTTISPMSSLGLVQMTRKRTRESLRDCICEQCPTCQGNGYVISMESRCCDIFRDVIKASNMASGSMSILVIAAAVVVDTILADPKSMAELESTCGKSIKLQTDLLFPPEQYDVVLI